MARAESVGSPTGPSLRFPMASSQSFLLAVSSRISCCCCSDSWKASSIFTRLDGGSAAAGDDSAWDTETRGTEKFSPPTCSEPQQAKSCSPPLAATSGRLALLCALRLLLVHAGKEWLLLVGLLPLPQPLPLHLLLFAAVLLPLLQLAPPAPPWPPPARVVLAAASTARPGARLLLCLIGHGRQVARRVLRRGLGGAGVR